MRRDGYDGVREDGGSAAGRGRGWTEPSVEGLYITGMHGIGVLGLDLGTDCGL